MTEWSCTNPEENCDLHACQLTANIRHPDIEKMFEEPRYVCTNCGAKVHKAENVCCPKEL